MATYLKSYKTTFFFLFIACSERTAKTVRSELTGLPCGCADHLHRAHGAVGHSVADDVHAVLRRCNPASGQVVDFRVDDFSGCGRVDDAARRDAVVAKEDAAELYRCRSVGRETGHADG